mmetsp:Transcript_55728/g.99229  ORF Transcript_55728/g.99229 Transcript_55728/m.99229 type:complete len:856 (+) Transcript_55728:158-2725(+)
MTTSAVASYGLMDLWEAIIAPFFSEILMFVMAALVYVLFTGFGWKHPQKKVKTKDIANVGRPNPSLKKQKDALAEELMEVHQPVVLHLRQGQFDKVLEALQNLSEEDAAALPSSLASKVLLGLARTPQLSEDITFQLMDFAGRLNSTALELAAAEASRWRNVAACRQLYNVAGLASIPKTERSITLLVRGHSKDLPALREFVEEVISSSSDTPMSRSMRDGIVAACLAAGATDAAQLVKESGQHTAAADMNRQAKFISNYGKDGNLQAALSTFQTLKAAGGTLHVVVYNCTLDACVECRDFKRAFEIFAEIKDSSLADVVTYNTMLKAYIAKRDPESARKLLSEMSSKGFIKNCGAYHNLLHFLVQSGDNRGVWKLIDQMVACGHAVNAVTCAIILKGILTRSQYSELTRILGLFEASGLVMDEVLFASLVEVCVRCGSLDMLWKYLKEFDKHTGMQTISAPTYGSMIKAFGQARDIERVRGLWSQMTACKVKPTAITAGCMVEALVHNHCLDEACDLVNMIYEDEELRPLANTVIYSSIIKGYTVLKQYNKVSAIYQEMKARKIQSNTITFNTVLNAMATCGMMCEVPQLLDDMSKCVPPAEPDIVTYSTIVKGYCIAGNLTAALQFFEDMKKTSKVAPDEVMYNSLLDGCAKQQCLDEALKLLDEMQQNKVAPSNFTLSILVKLLGRSRRLNQAFEMVDTMSKEHGFYVNVQVYTCLLQACINNRQMPRALALHDQIASDERCVLDQKIYTVLASGCLRYGMLDMAVKVLRCAWHLKGHDLKQAGSRPLGVEAGCLSEIVAELRKSNGAAAEELVHDLKYHRGVTVAEHSGSYQNQYHQRRGYGYHPKTSARS